MGQDKLGMSHAGARELRPGCTRSQRGLYRLGHCAMSPPDSIAPAAAATAAVRAAAAPRLRLHGAVNWVGLWTLLWREVRRFIKVGTQTIVAPVVTTLLMLAVFALAL